MSENQKLKVYIAAPFFNPEQLKVVMKIELMLEEKGIEFFSPRSEGTLIEMTPEERTEHMGNLFRSNVEHMDWCTHCVAVIDDYDTGTVWEMGYLYATGKKVVSFSDNCYGINVMLNESIVYHCVSYASIIDGLHGMERPEKTNEVT